MMNCPRCGKPIDEHEAGRETDACIAEVVMEKKLKWIEGGEPIGWNELGDPILFTQGYWFDTNDETLFLHVTDGFTGMVRYYSTSIADAWEVVEKITNEWRFRLTADYKREEKYRAAFCKWRTQSYKSYSSNECVAICRAALKAVIAE